MTIEYDENSTVCGYNLKELIFFAMMCRRHGISEEDIHEFMISVEATRMAVESNAMPYIDEYIQKNTPGV